METLSFILYVAITLDLWFSVPRTGTVVGTPQACLLCLSLHCMNPSWGQ